MSTEEPKWDTGTWTFFKKCENYAKKVLCWSCTNSFRPLKKYLESSKSEKCQFQLLEHDLFKNVSKWGIFLWQTQIQRNKYGLNDTKRIKKKQVKLIEK